jgi:hypothetical protein
MPRQQFAGARIRSLRVTSVATKVSPSLAVDRDYLVITPTTFADDAK